MAYFERVVLRLSGGLLRDADGVFGLEHVERVVDELVKVAGRTELIVVVGGGNIARGRDLSSHFQLDPKLADQVGMLATIANACFINALVQGRNVPSIVMSALEVESLIPGYSLSAVQRFLKFKQIVFLGGGTGRSGVTTDTAAVRLAGALRADILLKGTDVDGIFSADPKVDSSAELIPKLDSGEFGRRGLIQIFDPAAIRELTVPLRVFNILSPGSLLAAISGRFVGSLLVPITT